MAARVWLDGHFAGERGSQRFYLPTEYFSREEENDKVTNSATA